MRKLNSRVWNKKDKKMYYDGFYLTPDGELHWNDITKKDEEMIFMQSTGLDDFNDNKIYEGDILKCNTNYHGEIPVTELFALVMWDYTDRHWEGFIDYNDDLSGILSWGNCVIVGNSFENNNLLNEKQLYELANNYKK